MSQEFVLEVKEFIQSIYQKKTPKTKATTEFAVSPTYS